MHTISEYSEIRGSNTKGTGSSSVGVRGTHSTDAVKEDVPAVGVLLGREFLSGVGLGRGLLSGVDNRVCFIAFDMAVALLNENG